MVQVSLPFDRVHLGESIMAVHAFLELPLHARMEHLFSRTLKFTSAGEPVNKREALAALRNAWKPHQSSLS